MRAKILALTLIVVLTGCFSEPKIDASSEEAVQQSISKIIKTLNPDKQKQFQEALKILMLNDVNDFSDLVNLGQNIEVSKGVFWGKIDGKTADEIIAIAEETESKSITEAPKKKGDVLTADQFLEALDK